ncbi:hypothetical protein GGE65_004930 [Skermanella aerolata]|uniref:hypothetical protein n=1 Tax=Skermanella aerolata TaxID=393310 RepID=UPI003D1FACEF
MLTRANPSVQLTRCTEFADGPSFFSSALYTLMPRWQVAQLDTLRLHLIKLAAWIVETKRRITVLDHCLPGANCPAPVSGAHPPVGKLNAGPACSDPRPLRQPQDLSPLQRRYGNTVVNSSLYIQ